MATKPATTILQTEVPARLLAEMQSLVDAGWFRNLDEVMLDALRRFLDSHREDLTQALLREDVEWGLRGVENQSLPKAEPCP
ncbi:MAG TPA: ribbon-helix-helix domain-containing protein [Thermoanaerobaculia bacterium]|nr:ribbon-helix-helix domain-containing protein [Thermoanaerobaculia bacterium]